MVALQRVALMGPAEVHNLFPTKKLFTQIISLKFTLEDSITFSISLQMRKNDFKNLLLLGVNNLFLFLRNTFISFQNNSFTKLGIYFLHFKLSYIENIFTRSRSEEFNNSVISITGANNHTVRRETLNEI